MVSIRRDSISSITNSYNREDIDHSKSNSPSNTAGEGGDDVDSLLSLPNPPSAEISSPSNIGEKFPKTASIAKKILKFSAWRK